MTNPYKDTLREVEYLTIVKETQKDITFFLRTPTGTANFTFPKMHVEWDDKIRKAKIPQRYLRMKGLE